MRWSSELCGASIRVSMSGSQRGDNNRPSFFQGAAPKYFEGR
jgi:hypothetical protein